MSQATIKLVGKFISFVETEKISNKSKNPYILDVFSVFLDDIGRVEFAMADNMLTNESRQVIREQLSEGQRIEIFCEFKVPKDGKMIPVLLDFELA